MERRLKGRKKERREKEKGGALTGGQAACFAPALIQCLRPPAHGVGRKNMRKTSEIFCIEKITKKNSNF